MQTGWTQTVLEGRIMGEGVYSLPPQPITMGNNCDFEIIMTVRERL